MDCTKVWHSSGVISVHQTRFSQYTRSCILDGERSAIFLFKIVHKFSIGLRSGEFPGHVNNVTLCWLNQVLTVFDVWAGAESCWKIVQFVRVMLIRSLSSRIALYFSPLTVSPCSMVGIVYLGLYLLFDGRLTPYTRTPNWQNVDSSLNRTLPQSFAV